MSSALWDSMVSFSGRARGSHWCTLRSMRRVFALCLASTTVLAQGTAPLPNQTRDLLPDSTIRVTVNLVQVDVTVTDSEGRHVTDLKAQDFEILQDGRPQVIANFSSV